MKPGVLVSFRSADKAVPYLTALQSAGIDPIPCAPGERVRAEQVRGLVLTGGSDIDPAYYGQAPDADLDDVDRERDAFEFGLLAMADSAGLPILAICRGVQLLNVYRGGTLIQHLPQSERHRRTDTPKSQWVHNVRIEPGSRLASILESGNAQVNSRHHQAVDRVGDGLVITARDPEDQVVEAVEDPSRRFLIGVQWHPEDQAPADEVQRRLFTGFASCVRG
jgi:putative glutamine amidotransferase